jgi:predicted alpha/beta hydrolase family esterase
LTAPHLCDLLLSRGKIILTWKGFFQSLPIRGRKTFWFLSLGKGAAWFASEVSERIAIVNVPTLILPGIGKSDQAHWQTLWESSNPGFIRVQQKDWHSPVCDEWVNALEQAVAKIGDNPVLVAHSLGCLCVAHWAMRSSLNIKGALLVAPPDPEEGGFPPEATGFFPVPLGSLGFPSIVVASSNDPYGSLEFARSCALAWGSRFVNIGPAGHINSASGFGEWPGGWALYQELTA